MPSLYCPQRHRRKKINPSIDPGWFLLCTFLFGHWLLIWNRPNTFGDERLAGILDSLKARSVCIQEDQTVRDVRWKSGRQAKSSMETYKFDFNFSLKWKIVLYICRLDLIGLELKRRQVAWQKCSILLQKTLEKSFLLLHHHLFLLESVEVRLKWAFSSKHLWTPRL